MTLLSLIDFVRSPNVCSICPVLIDVLNYLSIVVNSVKLPPSLDYAFLLLMGSDLSVILFITYCQLI